MEAIKFPSPDRDKLLEQIEKLPIHGKPIRSRRNLGCVMCGRSILPLGRLAWPGAPLCTHEACELVSMSKVTRLFPTPYGRAVTPHILRVFCRTLEGDRLLVQRQPILKLAQPLTDAYLELLAWQLAYHDYDRISHPDAYALGQISLVPPRRLDEVLIFRSAGAPAPSDPTRHLPSELSRTLHRVKKHGPTALAVPF